LLMLGKLGVKGKGFCSTELQISTIFWVEGCSNSDWLLVGGFGIKFRAKTQRRKALPFDMGR
jgi:hypothetical protein